MHREKELASLQCFTIFRRKAPHVLPAAPALAQSFVLSAASLSFASNSATALHTPPSRGPHPRDGAGFRYNSRGLAEQDSLVEKGHQVRVSLKAALPARDTQQEVAPRKMWLGHSPRAVLLIMRCFLLSCSWHYCPMSRIKVKM